MRVSNLVGELLATYTVVGGVNGVAFSPDGELLATADADGTVRLWNPATGQTIGHPMAADTGTGGAVNGVAFSPNGNLLASADADGTVQLWNTAAEQAVGPPLPADLGYGVTGVAFSPDGNLLASADADGTVRLWNTATDRAIGTPLPADLGYAVTGVAFSPDGNLLASADADGTVQTWQMSLFVYPYAALCADVGSPTRADWTQYAPGSRNPTFAVDARVSAAHVVVSASPPIARRWRGGDAVCPGSGGGVARCCRPGCPAWR